MKLKKSDKVRVTVDLSPEVYEILPVLMKMSFTQTKAELIRNAIRYYRFILLQEEKGSTFCVKNPDGTYKEVLLVF